MAIPSYFVKYDAACACRHVRDSEKPVAGAKHDSLADLQKSTLLHNWEETTTSTGQPVGLASPPCLDFGPRSDCATAIAGRC